MSVQEQRSLIDALCAKQVDATALQYKKNIETKWKEISLDLNHRLLQDRQSLETVFSEFKEKELPLRIKGYWEELKKAEEEEKERKRLEKKAKRKPRKRKLIVKEET